MQSLNLVKAEHLKVLIFYLLINFNLDISTKLEIKPLLNDNVLLTTMRRKALKKNRISPNESAITNSSYPPPEKHLNHNNIINIKILLIKITIFQ